MNEFVDMHVHSKFSIDGMSTMEDYCLIAGKTGTRVICFTEHVDFNSAEKNLSIVKDNRKQNFVVDDYFREINRLRKKYGSLTLLSGIEFSEPSLFPEEFALYYSLRIYFIYLHVPFRITICQGISPSAFGVTLLSSVSHFL